MTDSTKSKEDLERIKLEREISDLERSPWTRPTIIVPIVAALVTLALSQYLGVFDVERKRVELQTKESEIRRVQLQGDLAILEVDKKALEKDKKDLDQRKTSLGRDVGSLQEKADKLKREMDIIGNEVPTIQGSVSSALQYTDPLPQIENCRNSGFPSQACQENLRAIVKHTEMMNHYLKTISGSLDRIGKIVNPYSLKQ
jgi:hypothetical protein